MKKIQRLAKILTLITENKSREEKEKIVIFFLEILKQKKKIHLLSKILKEVKREEKKKEVILTLARKSDDKIIKEIKEKIRDALGKEKKFKIKIDENIIGGFLAKSQNYIIDASIKGMLNKFKEKLWKFSKF